MAAKQNLSIPNKQIAAFNKWAEAVTNGVIPGETVSGRINELIKQDLERNSYKLRKAGIKSGGANAKP